jgi:selenophosphate synthetase-related protein
MVNTIAYNNEEKCRLILSGIKEGCIKFRVPMVGGHIMPDAPAPSLSVSILGKAGRLLTSFGCQIGDAILLAVDLDGRHRDHFLHWDTTSHKETPEVLRRLEALRLVAQRGLATAAKDVSNPGILGTVGMLLETSGKGGIVDLHKIPRPEGLGLKDWLKMYPGFGFILSIATSKVEEVKMVFRSRGVAAEVIGQVTAGRRMLLRQGEELWELFDLERESITGICLP